MTKVGKTKRRMKRTVRKTIGGLFMASAIAVAALPVDNLLASPGGGSEPGIVVDIENCRIPIVDEGETVYTTGDGMFQFAYVTTNDTSSGNKIAVILGYDGGRLLNGALQLPNTVDAYLKYSENLGTSFGYCAVGKSGNFLFYDEAVDKKDSFGNPVYENDLTKPIVDESGLAVKDPVTGEYLYEQKVVQEIVYRPCYYNDYAKWSDREVNELYYETTPGNGIFQKTEISTYQRIQDATVKYIGNQRLKAGEGDAAGTWTIVKKADGGYIDTPEEGIFRGEKAGNVVTLSVGPDLSGIGDYAFYGCTNLTSITLENGLDTIGNHAFEKCVNLEMVDVDIAAMLSTVGASAFEDCRALKSFVMPRQVEKIGDKAFKGCTRLTDIDLCGQGKNVQLSKLGYDVFVNCEALESITFPDSYKENDLDIAMFAGCISLKYIKDLGGEVQFKEYPGSVIGFEGFRSTVPSTFYFEGRKESNLYRMASEKSFAFRYLDQDVYEITERDEFGNQKAVYQVNSDNQLIYCEIKSGTEDVSLPGTIGPYNITTIDSNSFQNSCYLKEITIPSSITSIASNAFKGCHNLETVIFTNPVNITNIGPNAFKTQDVYKDACDAHGKSGACKNYLDAVPKLTFVGPIGTDCVPFTYAMDPQSNINIDSQQRTYITYLSGWPTNLEVQYNPATDKNELINYPTFSQINGYTLSSYPYMTDEYVSMAHNAYAKYTDSNTAMRDTMTDGEWAVVNSALAIELPEGIESVKKDLFVTKEAGETAEKKIFAYSIEDIPAQAFKGISTLTEISFYGGTKTVGDYAFEGCNRLESVYFPETLEEMGKRPFKDCPVLKRVYFLGDSDFMLDNSIIFKLDSHGEKEKVIEYLESRASGVINPQEMTGVKEIAPEAFRNTNVSFVDLRQSSIENIPEFSFADTAKLAFLYLPVSWNNIEKDAFYNSALQYLELPGQLGYIDNEAFSGTTNNDGSLTFNCEENSAARRYATQNNIKVTDKEVETYYKVRFWGFGNILLDTIMVKSGGDATPVPVPDPVDGYELTGWSPSIYGITRDMDITAIYEKEDPDKVKYTVTFLDWDGKELGKQQVGIGKDAVAPADPSRDGYQFTGWVPGITNIHADTTAVAQYNVKDDRLTVRFFDDDGTTVLYTQLVEPGKNAMLPQSPVKTGYTFKGWLPAPNNITKDTDVFATYEKADGTQSGGPGGNSNTPGGNASSKLYTLTVRNGSGSGSYAAGTQVIIIANDPDQGKAFGSWALDDTSVKIASNKVAATVLTMPEKDVTVTANFVKGESSTNGSGSSVSGNSAGKPSTTPQVSSKPVSSGTTVVIDKNGLSNTGVVSATVNGSSDNFTIKISESSAAAELALKALMAEYGDVSNIKYFPMDISLYDSTGKKEITDTTGLSIKVTLPLPDSLITYAGNNKVASVKGGKLEKLDVKFNTISGVACVTFTAEHFSPYVIYVDTENLTANGTISGSGPTIDYTPKTGDGIHPKWFLSLGLAFTSVAFFMKKDKKKKVQRA